MTAVASALLLIACQTTDKGSSSTEGQTQETEGGFRAPAEPDSTASDTSQSDTKLELRPVYFGYDRSDLTQEARSSLRESSSGLEKASGVTTLEGHTDERGTFEYNMALGDRRANAVKKYLVALGVPASKIRTLSYGEANPAVKGHDESAWRWNRRVTVQQ
jgi:peptidoglycan-associated lipoprotein